MSVAINKVMIGGNLTRDPEVKFTNSEKAVANFGICVNRRYKGSDGEMKDEATFIDVEAWGRTAELVGQYLTKGRACFVEGRLKLDLWEDKDGQKRSKLKVVADSVQFLDSGNRGDRGATEHHAGTDADIPASETKPKPSRPAPAFAGEDEPPF